MMENTKLIQTEANKIKGMFEATMAKMSNMNAGQKDSTTESSPPKTVKCRRQQTTAVSPAPQSVTARFGAAHK
eukprot:14138690-Ditylum_brightwellii.AAC.1